MEELEVLYYSNGHGGVAISVDGGEYVIVRTGRRLLLSETKWEEADEDEVGLLSPEQETAIDDVERERAAMTPEQSVMSEIVLNYRRRRLREAQINPTAKPEKPKREVDPSVMVEYSDLIND